MVASALGIPSLLPFLKAVCRSKKSWQARHTGIKIVQQIAILMGCAILPHLKNLVEIIENGKESITCLFALSSTSAIINVYKLSCVLCKNCISHYYWGALSLLWVDGHCTYAIIIIQSAFTICMIQQVNFLFQ